MKPLHGLSTVNVELTSRCNKSCWMCGRRKIEREYPEIAKSWGDMDFGLVEKIAKQLPPGIVVQFHNNGEPLLYPRFGEAVKLFENQIKCVDTNAKLIVEKADEIIDNLHTITISVIEDDREGDDQYELVKEFLSIKGEKKPRVIFRFLGEVNPIRWQQLNGLYVYRQIHNPMGSYGYKRRTVKPEIGICLEILHHMAIDRYGNVSICVRFDPEGHGIVGNARDAPLEDIWSGNKRALLLNHHIKGRRDMIPLCNRCEYWGVPTG